MFGNPSPEWLLLLVFIPAFIVAIVQLVCLVLVIVEMFKRGETGLGIACAALSFCTGVGGLIAFVYGWIKASDWGLKRVMWTWTACVVLQLVLVVAGVIGGAFSAPVMVQPAPAIGM